MYDSADSNQAESLSRLNELALDHLSIPRPGRSAHVRELEDHLPPGFIVHANGAA